MDTELKKILLGLIVTGIIGGIVKLYLDYKTRLLENLWQKRLESYTKFVKLTSLFPKYPFPQSVTWQDVLILSMSFRDWYFEGNGIVASRYFRDKYFKLQEYVVSLLSADRVNNKIKLDDTEYDDLRKKCSEIRTLIARELESRENPIWYRFTKRKEA